MDREAFSVNHNPFHISPPITHPIPYNHFSYQPHLTPFPIFLPVAPPTLKRKLDEIPPQEEQKEDESNKKRRVEMKGTSLSEDDSLSTSDSGSDNPRSIDYYLADSLLEENFDPVELYPMMGEVENEDGIKLLQIETNLCEYEFVHY
eukprot:TRINITY_DN5260_c0_g1_i2.p1 TRINITY_DN5260_c0_g1~~TRINITY_DN5260_c0_g1_i2.p1  ORF type:complete len:147 (+),score=29.08 TRINITY_DN5260_c0_g1_i2:147-587(+)